MKTPIEIAIIGAGATGLMAAITSKDNPNASVSIFEKTNKALSKLRTSGGGRCNVTKANNEEDVRSEFEKLRLSNKLVYNYNPFNITMRLWIFLLDKIDISES